MADFLITGGAGFIGSNTEHLVRQGRRVRVLDNFLTGKRANLTAVTGQAEIVEGDLRDLPAVQKAVAGCRYVLHVGALPSVPRSIEDPLTTNAINVTGTLNVLLAARDAGVERVVFSSSSSVYGNTPTLPKHEDMIPSPLSPYATHKITGEYYCRAFWQLYKLPTIVLRYFNVFGPRQDPQSQYAAVIPRFITSILAGKSPTIFGDGSQSRDFSYIDNVIAANLAGSTAPPAAYGEHFNIACGGRVTLLELVATINRQLGTNVPPILGTTRAGDVQHSQADIAKAGKLLGWQPQVSFEAGIAKTIEWYRN